MTVYTTTAHGLVVGSKTKGNVVMTGMAFTCSLDSGAYQHIYPRNRDRFYNTAIDITGVGNTPPYRNMVRGNLIISTGGLFPRPQDVPDFREIL